MRKKVVDLLNDLDADNPLWRYMDTSKFLDLILHKKLVFPRFDKFEDPYEGYASYYVDLLKKELQDQGAPEAKIKYGSLSFTDFVNISNYYAYVSCWHHNNHESAGMWKLYCSTPESLVIKTNVKALKKSLSMNKEYKLVFSKVTYDSKLEGYSIKNLRNVNVFNALLMKRESFDHEKEYRILLIDDSDRDQTLENHNQKCEDELTTWLDKELKELLLHRMENNLNPDVSDDELLELSEKYVPSNTSLKNTINELKKIRPVIKSIEIDLDVLIHEIVVSPYAPNWFVRTIEKLISDLGYSFKVSQSKLYELS